MKFRAATFTSEDAEGGAGGLGHSRTDDEKKTGFAAPTPPITGVALAVAPFASLFEFVPALLCLAAVGAVAVDFPFEFLFGALNAPVAITISVARLSGCDSAEQQKGGQQRHE